MGYKVIDGGVLVTEKAGESIGEVEAIVFDCDGTLADVSPSLHLLGRLISAIILDRIYGVDCRIGEDYDEAFHLLKMLGGFNNVRNAVSILMQAIILEMDDPKPMKSDPGEIDDLEYYLGRLRKGRSRPAFIERSLEWIKSKCINMLGKYVTKKALEELILRRAEEEGKLKQLTELREIIEPVVPYGYKVLGTLYRELWLGSEGIEERHGVKPRYYHGAGLIEEERILIREEVLEELRSLVPKGLVIISGRGSWEAGRTLDPILEYFNLEASVFTGDKPSGMEKPNPASLLECCSKLGVRKVIYVGDAGEDLFLTRNASRVGLEAYLVGLLVNRYSYTLFTKCGAEAILENVNLLPKLFK